MPVPVFVAWAMRRLSAALRSDNDAAPLQSLGFALVGALLITSMILMYTAWGYWVFRGKVRRGYGYH